MRIREIEKSVITPEGGGLYCVVCKTRSCPGEEFYVFRSNKYIGRHPGCAVKNPVPVKKEEPKAIILDRPAQSTHRRRSGGSGYSGGYGFHEI